MIEEAVGGPDFGRFVWRHFAHETAHEVAVRKRGQIAALVQIQQRCIHAPGVNHGSFGRRHAQCVSGVRLFGKCLAFLVGHGRDATPHQHRLLHAGHVKSIGLDHRPVGVGPVLQSLPAVHLAQRHGPAVARLHHVIRPNDGSAIGREPAVSQLLRVQLAGDGHDLVGRRQPRAVARLERLWKLGLVARNQVVKLDHLEFSIDLPARRGYDLLALPVRCGGRWRFRCLLFGLLA